MINGIKLGDIAAALSAAAVGADALGADAEKPVCGVSTDTRTLKPGELFIPLVGERFDGHDYIDAAFDRGAVCVLSQQPLSTRPVITVKDTGEALLTLAGWYRERLGVKVAAITGSSGKTTTKDMTAAVLGSIYKTHKTAGNLNNTVGVPLTLFAAPEGTEAMVIEMGMNHFGEIAQMTAAVKPDAAVITNIGKAHIEYLGSREGILKAKLEIIEGLRPGGVLIYNGDEPLLRDAAAKLQIRTVAFGFGADCTVRAEDVQYENGVSAFTVSAFGKRFSVRLPAVGDHNVADALAAVAVGLEFGVSERQIAEGLAAFKNGNMRQNIFERGGITIIDDTYNANPDSMAAALKVLAGFSDGRRIAVLADMLELGEAAAKEHYETGLLAAQCCEAILLYGELSYETLKGALQSPPQIGVRLYHNKEEAAKVLAALARPGDTILFKGSRGMKTEEIMNRFFEVKGI